MKNKIFFLSAFFILLSSGLIILIGCFQLEKNINLRANLHNDTLIDNVTQHIETKLNHLASEQSINDGNILDLYRAYREETDAYMHRELAKSIEAELRQTTYINPALISSFMLDAENGETFYSEKNLSYSIDTKKILEDFSGERKTHRILRNVEYFGGENDLLCFFYRSGSSAIFTVADVNLLFRDSPFNFFIYGENIRYAVGKEIGAYEAEAVVGKKSLGEFSVVSADAAEYTVYLLTEKEKLAGSYANYAFLLPLTACVLLAAGIVCAYFFSEKLTDLKRVSEPVRFATDYRVKLEIKAGAFGNLPIRKQFNAVFYLVIFLPLALITSVFLAFSSAFCKNATKTSVKLLYDINASNLAISDEMVNNTLHYFLFTDSLQQMYYRHYNLMYADWSTPNQFFYPVLDSEDFKYEIRNYDLHAASVSDYVFLDTDFQTIYYSAYPHEIAPTSREGYFIKDGKLFYIKKAFSLYKTKEAGHADYTSTALRNLGYIALFIDTASFYDNLHLSENANDISYFYILDDEVILTNVAEKLGASKVSLLERTESENVYQTGNAGGPELIFIADTNLVFDEYSPILFTTLFLFLALSVAIYSFSVRAAKQYTGELETFTENLAAVNTPRKLIGGNYKTNEIKQLQSAFNDMLTRIDAFQSEIQTNKRKIENLEKIKQQAELIAYQQQVNPHFLSNAFASAAILIKMNNPNALPFITSIAKLLRLSLYRNNVIIPLEEETEHLRAYLDIQKIRFKDAIRSRVDIDENVSGLYTMKLILQPIVENTFVHGLESVGQGNVWVRIYADEEFLVYEIRDDGVGIGEENLAAIKKSLLTGDASAHLGLVNVNTRIKLNCGERYGVQIESTENVGTTVTVFLPKNLTPPHSSSEQPNPTQSKSASYSP